MKISVMNMNIICTTIHIYNYNTAAITNNSRRNINDVGKYILLLLCCTILSLL